MPNRSKLIDDIIAKTPDWRGATLAKLRKIIRDADPGIIEEVKWRRPSNPLGAAVWEHDGIVCIGGILKERVRLTLYDGARDPGAEVIAAATSRQKRRVDQLDVDAAIHHRLDAVGDLDQLAASAGAFT